MARVIAAPPPVHATVASATPDGIESAAGEVLGDQLSADVEARLSAPVEEQYATHP